MEEVEVRIHCSGVVDGAFFSARTGRALLLLSIVSREIEKERKENNEPNAFIHFLKISSADGLSM